MAAGEAKRGLYPLRTRHRPYGSFPGPQKAIRPIPPEAGNQAVRLRVAPCAPQERRTRIRAVKPLSGRSLVVPSAHGSSRRNGVRRDELEGQVASRKRDCRRSYWPQTITGRSQSRLTIYILSAVIVRWVSCW